MRVIQVGIGGMGGVWLRTVLEAENVEFTGFVDVNATVIERQTSEYNLDRNLVFPSLERALDNVQADAVINVTPPQFHRDVSIIALEAGLPVLSEKPLAGTLADALAIVRKSDETGVLHMVAQNYRYSVPVQTAKQALAQMGAVSSVAVEFFRGPRFGGFREEMDYPLIIDMSIHHFDMMRFFLEADPVTVHGRSWNPPWSWFAGDASASVLATFGDSTTVSYDGSWCSNGYETAWNGNWRFECEKGVLTLRDDLVQRHSLTGPEGRFDKDAHIETVEPVTMPHVAQAYLLQEFYQAVQQGTTPATTCQDNIKSLMMVFDVVRSFETGEVIQTSAT